eukprot:CAMPEP_0206227070 /NCGR_PEP_ID=MMETSP0047_2-20121206/8429_1 /ASSEMBLY_ACC=CAM_ASM_000192 /TAXON_ID=195065 /ORGANISM="Chroomonas mesostigmatica_cf, Strain CCMP1168" /LENGTH=149 /DNA_ID=CAMNT_0053650201 /DNA_START=51 /DNA_END=500 /DNA_ORIENTATION=+
MMFGRAMAVSAYLLFLCLAVVDSASKVDHHTVKMHTAFIKARKDEDFSHWKEAFEKADSDKDGKIAVKEVGRVFKEHYNLYHEEKPRGMAAEMHFMDDANDFIAMVERNEGWADTHQMTEEEFMKHMHTYVDIKLQERGSLYDIAAHIF